jgi:hypothetical protein
MTTNPEKQVEKKPFRAEIRFTLLAENLEEAGELLDRIDNFAEALGFFGEGGAIDQMKQEEVVPGSPLEKRLGEQAFDLKRQRKPADVDGVEAVRNG